MNKHLHMFMHKHVQKNIIDIYVGAYLPTHVGAYAEPTIKIYKISGLGETYIILSKRFHVKQLRIFVVLDFAFNSLKSLFSFYLSNLSFYVK